MQKSNRQDVKNMTQLVPVIFSAWETSADGKRNYLEMDTPEKRKDWF